MTLPQSGPAVEMSTGAAEYHAQHHLTGSTGSAETGAKAADVADGCPGGPSSPR
ncbi:hypothetical protein ACFQ0T_27025 [Kitasatospora gansuensis]